MNRGRLFHRVSAFALCLALAGLAAGCGGGSKTTAATTPSGGSSTTPATTTPPSTATTPAASAATVAPPGAAYRFQLPVGLKLASASASQTLAVPASLPADSGTIVLSEAAPNVDLTSAQAIDRALKSLDRQEVAFDRSHGGKLGPGTRTTIAGHPAICWKVSHFDNSFGGAHQGIVDAESCAIVADKLIVQLGCNWKPSARAIVERGCAAVRASLRISTSGSPGTSGASGQTATS